MILRALVGLSLLIPATLDSGIETAPTKPANAMTAQQKNVVIRPLIRSATECIVRKVARDPRIRAAIDSSDVRDLIVDSMPSCVDAVRAMIDVYDQLFGEGAGETFFTGPYLDGLPATVLQSVKNASE